MIPVFDSTWGNERSALMCPSCGNSSLHMAQTETFFRAEEDVATGTVVKVAGANASLDFSGSQADNPSARRDGLRIRFICELCHDWSDSGLTSPKLNRGEPKLSLCVVQHKGHTLVYWEDLK